MPDWMILVYLVVGLSLAVLFGGRYGILSKDDEDIGLMAICVFVFMLFWPLACLICEMRFLGRRLFDPK